MLADVGAVGLVPRIVDVAPVGHDIALPLMELVQVHFLCVLNGHNMGLVIEQVPDLLDLPVPVDARGLDLRLETIHFPQNRLLEVMDAGQTLILI